MVISLIGETVSKNNNKINEIAKSNMHGRVALFVCSCLLDRDVVHCVLIPLRASY